MLHSGWCVTHLDRPRAGAGATMQTAAARHVRGLGPSEACRAWCGLHVPDPSIVSLMGCGSGCPCAAELRTQQLRGAQGRRRPPGHSSLASCANHTLAFHQQCPPSQLSGFADGPLNVRKRTE